MAKRQGYSFRLLYQSEEELAELQQGQSTLDPWSLEQIILPNGLPNFKTVSASGESEDEAWAKANAYVSKTPYRDIEDGKLVS